MPSKSKRQAILKLLKAAKSQTELQVECAALINIMGQDNYKPLLEAHCKRRYQDHDMMTQSACDQLYWKIITRLVGTTAIHSLFPLFFPGITKVLTPQITVKSRPSLIRITLEESSIESLDEEITMDTLSSFVIFEQYLFDVREISRFNFDFHRACHDEIYRTWPVLADRLYQRHNQSFKILSDLLVETRTPLQAITLFTQQLNDGGAHNEGTETLASIDAQRAFTDFICYINTLPNDIQLTLLSLAATVDGSGTIGEILDSIEDLGCIEIATDELTLVINRASNRAFLTTHPCLSKHELKAIAQQYHDQELPSNKGKILSTENQITTIVPPVADAMNLDRVNYSFYLNSLTALIIVTGATLVVLSMFLPSQPLGDIGIVLISTGTATLAAKRGFFAQRPREEIINPLEEIPQNYALQ